MFTRIDHVSITVQNLEKSIGFYEDHFGFELLFNDVIPHGQRITYLMLGSTILELVEQKEEAIINSQHFCLHTNDFSQDYQSLIEQGVRLWRLVHDTAARTLHEINWKRAVFLGLDNEQIEIRG